MIFKVTFPQTLNDSSINQIKTALSMQKKADEDMETEETVNLVKYEENQRNTHAQGGTQGDESDEDDEGHSQGQRMQCAQQ